LLSGADFWQLAAMPKGIELWRKALQTYARREQSKRGSNTKLSGTTGSGTSPEQKMGRDDDGKVSWS
jgi:hypothetical protein